MDFTVWLADSWLFLKRLSELVVALAALISVWETLKYVHSRLAERLPVTQLLGRLADGEAACLIFVSHLYTPANDNKYKLQVPDFFPPQTTGKEEDRVNIPRVFAKGDSTAVGDVLNAMGQAGRHEGIEVVDPVTHWENWEASIICIGGSFKSDRVWEKCQPLPVVLDGGGFKNNLTGERWSAANNQDFGLLCKTKNLDTERDVWLVIGLGPYGTPAASHFLRANLGALGRMYGAEPFAVVVRTTLTEGSRQASLWWFSPPVKLWRQIAFRGTYKRFSRRRAPIPGGSTFIPHH